MLRYPKAGGGAFMILGASGKFSGAVVSSLPQDKPRGGGHSENTVDKISSISSFTVQGWKGPLPVLRWGTTSFISSSVLGREGVCVCGGVCVRARARPKSLPSCPTLCDPVDCSPPGSSVHGVSQARMLE